MKKKGTKHAPKKAAGGPPKVRVQMFRQGLGDSFLVTLDHGGPDERRMLIDCGTLGNKFSDTDTAAVAAHLLAVVDDDDKRIDVLVATHEHMDHVSGFRNHLRPVLKGNVDEVWLAWTEKPKDPDAERLAKFKGDLGVALQRVSQVSPGVAVCNQVADLLGFAGDIKLDAKFAETADDAMDFVRTGTGGKTVYRDPGELIESLPGFRVRNVIPDEPNAKTPQWLVSATARSFYELYLGSLSTTFR